jgi:hypothetical protein
MVSIVLLDGGLMLSTHRRRPRSSLVTSQMEMTWKTNRVDGAAERFMLASIIKTDATESDANGFRQLRGMMGDARSSERWPGSYLGDDGGKGGAQHVPVFGDHGDGIGGVETGEK